MNPLKPFSKDIIILDNVEEVVSRIVAKLREDISQNFRRNGAVVGISGGIDSSVCMALAAEAFGPHKVLGIMLPEKDSSPDSEMLARELADKFGVKAIKEEITSALSGFGCYERRDEAVSRVFPEYDPKTYKMKIGIRQSGLFTSLPPMFSLIIIDKNGTQQEKTSSRKRVSADSSRIQFQAAHTYVNALLSCGGTPLCCNWNSQ